MYVRDLEQGLKARPIEPFVMRLSSGEKIRADHSDAAVPGTNAVLVIRERGGRLAGFTHGSLFHVARIEPANGATNGRSHKNKDSESDVNGGGRCAFSSDLQVGVLPVTSLIDNRHSTIGNPP